MFAFCVNEGVCGYVPETGTHHYRPILLPEGKHVVPSGRKSRFVRVLAEPSQSLTIENNGHLVISLSKPPRKRPLETSVGVNR